MAAQSSYRGLHVHFFFADNCGHCVRFKREGGSYQTLQSKFREWGLEIDETQARDFTARIKGGLSKGILQREFLKYTDGGYPGMIVIRKDIYDIANTLPLLEVLKTVQILNHKLNFKQDPSSDSFLISAPSITSWSETNMRLFLDTYLRSDEYKYGDEILKAKSSHSKPSSVPIISPPSMRPPSTSGTSGVKTISAPSSSSSAPRPDLGRVAPLSQPNMMTPTGSTESTRQCKDGVKLLPFYR